MSATILVADDHVEMAAVVGEHLERAGYRCIVVASGRAALAALAAETPDVVITDLRMAEVDGLDVLDAAHRLDPELPVILMTAFGAIESAIEAMRRGAYHYVVKPVRLEELTLHVRRALDRHALVADNRRLRARERSQLGAMVGGSEVMQRVYDLVLRIAPSPAAVLVRGESGSGKELVARAIHDASPRRERPFVAINCATLPEHLLESELFGHVRGAFTGATGARAGLFVEAAGGTLFLDEIGDMPAGLQARLLRVLEDGEIRAIGADGARKVDVRVIAATHHDLERKITEGTFRADLFYRLDVVPLRVPPLRDRLEDVAPLVAHFLARARERNPHSPVRGIADDLVPALVRYPWPGNVRELQNVIERMVVIGAEPALTAAQLQAVAPHITGGADRFSLPRDRLATLEEVEAEYIAWMIEQCGGNKTRAAERLGVDPSTLHRRARAKR
jgi:two-component system response regulator HydG